MYATRPRAITPIAGYRRFFHFVIRGLRGMPCKTLPQLKRAPRRHSGTLLTLSFRPQITRGGRKSKSRAVGSALGSVPGQNRADIDATENPISSEGKSATVRQMTPVRTGRSMRRLIQIDAIDTVVSLGWHLSGKMPRLKHRDDWSRSGTHRCPHRPSRKKAWWKET